MSTITRRLTAISQAHQFAGHPTPTRDERVRTVLKGIRRRLGTAQRGKAPATIEVAPGKACTTHATSRDAWTAARSASKPDDLICVTGSVFLAGELRAVVCGPVGSEAGPAPPSCYP